ncbi:unnamed protein product [Boreogadus saida]
MNNDNPKKPLVLSFHGTGGTGKTWTSQLIVKNIYKKGMDSGFVHYFNPVINFPDASQVECYKSQLQHLIRGKVTNCAHSMFIFDEMDTMHRGIIDSIKPFMDYQYKLDGVSYQKAIFLFLRYCWQVAWQCWVAPFCAVPVSQDMQLHVPSTSRVPSPLGVKPPPWQTSNDTCASEIVNCVGCKIGPQVPSTVRPIEPPPEAVQGLGVPIVPHTQQAVDDLEDLQTKHKGHQQLQEITLTPGVIPPPEHHPVRELKAYMA